MRILLAEDNPFQLNMIKSILEEYNFDVISVKDGKQAWEILNSENPPGIALLDWVMPEMEGPEVCRKFRSIHKNKPAYLILLSAKVEKNNIIEGLKAGADDYLTKPFDKVELYTRLQTGIRIMELQRNLSSYTQQLENDIIRREMAEKALKESEEKFRELVEKAEIAIVKADKNGNFLYFNDRFTQLFAYQKDDINSLNFFDLIHDDDKENFKTLINNISRKNINRYDFKAITRDNHLVFVEAKPVSFNSSETGSGVLWYLWDITDRVQAEKKYHQVNEELENRVNQRTQELNEVNHKLESSLIAEKELVKMKTRFIDLISHEYRTPLTVIQSSTDLISMYSDKEAYEKIPNQISLIKSSVYALTSLIEDVITFSNLGDNKIAVRPLPINLIDLLNELLTEIKVLDSGEHQFELVSEIDNITIFSDKSFIVQIFTQLLLNAIKYSAPKSKIHIRLSQFSDEQISISVIDNGIGISETDLRKIYTPFFKSQDSIGLKSGSGMGLAIVKRLVKAIESEISVESTLGRGSNFTIRMPIKIESNY